MKQNAHFSPALRRCAKGIGIFAALFCPGIANASFTITTAADYTCQLIATSLHNTGSGSVPNYIYDDGTTNYSGGFGSSSGSPWNCGRQFLVAEYTGLPVTLAFSYGDEADSSWPAMHNIIITNLTTGVVILNTFPASGGAGLILDADPYILNSTARGEYQIQYYRPGATPGTDSADITGRVVLVPQIQKLWITAPPICSGFSGNYNFQVHSIPPLDSIMIPSHAWAEIYGVTTDCTDPRPENYINLDFTASVPAIHTYWDYHGLTSNEIEVPGNGWATELSILTTDIDNDLDLNDYDIVSSNLAPYLTGAPGTASPVISLTFSDGIASILTATANLIIEYPAIPASSYVGDSLDAPVGPPNASGIPWPSYDIFNYTVSGAEVWSPSNNPISRMDGSDVVYNTIRIQNTLLIPPGGSLTLDSMTLEFGPNGAIVVQPAATTTATGGFLSLNKSTLTAYRGCNGTDQSTWQGIQLLGNPSLDALEATSPYWQSNLYMIGSKISYANIGITNGAPSATGGSIYAANYPAGIDTFYNNKEAVRLYPHTPASSFYFNYCMFLSDANVWWHSVDLFNATGVNGIYLDHCTFRNRTGDTIYEAISANEATMVVSSTIDSFYYGINSWYATATHGLQVSGATFTNNHMGVIAYGAMAPLIADNTFNIPPYTGGGGVVLGNSGLLEVDDQNVGAVISCTPAYSLFDNVFQTAAVGAGNYYRLTTGTLEWNNGSDNNTIYANTFIGLGVAMLSNYINNNPSLTAFTGLQYTCNTENTVGYDIAVVGRTSGIGGIRRLQATALGTTTLPAGNVLSGIHYNLYNTQQWFSYIYDNLAAPQIPALVSPLSGATGVSANPEASAGECYYGNLYVDQVAASTAYGHAIININNYMTGAPLHRDSLYYWAGQLNTPYGDLLITNLLTEDQYYDSATTKYDSIINKYSLDSSSIEGSEFVQGRNLIDLLIYKQQNSEPLMTLTAAEETTLQSIAANTTLWAHGRAAGWLNAYNGTPITDTLLYPNPPDTSGGGERHAIPAQNNTPVNPKNEVYPNPVNDQLEVNYTAQTSQPVTIEIDDISGRAIITQSLQTGQPTPINVSRLTPGIYLYRVMEGGAATMIGKIAKD